MNLLLSCVSKNSLCESKVCCEELPLTLLGRRNVFALMAFLVTVACTNIKHVRCNCYRHAVPMTSFCAQVAAMQCEEWEQKRGTCGRVHKPCNLCMLWAHREKPTQAVMSTTSPSRGMREKLGCSPLHGRMEQLEELHDQTIVSDYWIFVTSMDKLFTGFTSKLLKGLFWWYQLWNIDRLVNNRGQK